MELCYKMIHNIVLWKNEAINDLENVVLDCDIFFDKTSQRIHLYIFCMGGDHTIGGGGGPEDWPIYIYIHTHTQIHTIHFYTEYIFDYIYIYVVYAYMIYIFCFIYIYYYYICIYIYIYTIVESCGGKSANIVNP